MRSRLVLGGVFALILIAVPVLPVGAARHKSPATSTPIVPLSDPVSFSFDSAANGWVLGFERCARTMGCVALRETLDHGRSWRARSLPAALVAQSNKSVTTSAVDLSISFANDEDGWIYGLEGGHPVFFSTHDGGVEWRRLSTSLEGSYGFIYDVASFKGTAYLVAQSASYHGVLESSPIGRDNWRRVRTPALELPAGGAIDGGAIVFRGDSGWLVVGNDRGVSGSARLTSKGRWVKWSSPCASVGDSYVVPISTTPRDVVVACQMGGFASPLSASAPPGATLGSVWLYTSRDGGLSFRHGPPLGRWFESILAAPSLTNLFATRILNSKTAFYQQFVHSVDGGHHWRIVRRERALSVAFQSSRQGVALLQGAHDVNTMIMTSDGGEVWTAIEP